MPNLYAYTHKYKKYNGNHNSHNSHNKHNGSNGVFGDRRTAPSLHDITLKMRKMYDAVAGSFSSFNDPSKPFTAIDYRRIHNGWKNKKNGRFNRMNRMNRMKRMKTMNGGKYVYEFFAEDIDDDQTKFNVNISRSGKEDFKAFIEKLAANDGPNANTNSSQEIKNNSTQHQVEIEQEKQETRTETVREQATKPGIEDNEEGVFIKAAALTASAVALAIASENEKSTEDETAGLLVKAAALASIATAMAIVSENP